MGEIANDLQAQDADLAKGRSVLIVDDEQDIRESLQRLVKASFKGLRVDTAASGAEGLQLLESKTYDIVASDFRMPGMDGVEFLTQVKNDYPEPYRVMMTAYPEKEVSQRAAEDAEVETFFTKPLDPVTVTSTVKDLLRQRWLDTAHS